MGFYAYNPLGGGLFTGGFSKDGQVEKGSRFDPEKWQGKIYRSRYFKDEYFAALDIVKPAADKHGLTMAEVALRWMTHHSQLKRKFPDAILIGASRSVLGAEDQSRNIMLMRGIVRSTSSKI